MEHFWRELPGYCTFAEDWYPEMVRRMPSMARVVEVGVYAGQSSACLAVELINQDKAKAGSLDLVDWFTQVPKETVVANLEPVAGVIGAVHQCLSWDGARLYDDASLDAVFIDASHEYPHVAADIDAWRPKVRPGGILSGHDFCLEFPGVIQAVTERFARFEVWQGTRFCTDAPMQGKLYPCWAVRV